MELGQPPELPPQRCYPIGGVRVQLPVKPYPCQLAMMAKIINGLQKGHNCLLESPTGSGKSLALLCSTLAWQREQKEKAERYNALLDAGITDPDILARAAGLKPGQPRPTPGDPESPRSPKAPEAPTTKPTTNPVASEGGFFYDDDDDFRTPESFKIPEVGEAPEPMPAPMDQDDSFINMDPGHQERPRKLRVPKVFIGTRTHKQVEQMVKELRRTAYKDINMVVLSSREHTCIHPVVSKSNNKNEMCQDLNDPVMARKREWMEMNSTATHSYLGDSCRYYHGVNRIKTHETLAQCGGLKGAWDIEDLVQVGHKVHACPYFTARGLLSTADLIICPYNYLVDPSIRETMDIHLKNHVLILDEAHNIEDFSRESASCTITKDELQEAISHLETRDDKREACEKLAAMLSTLLDWMEDNSDGLTSYVEYGRAGKILTGTEIVGHFEQLNIGRERFKEFHDAYQLLEERDPDLEEPRLHPVAKKILGQFLLVYHYMLKDNMKYIDDYRVALIKQQVMKKPSQSLDRWISKKSTVQTEYSINFWCLNPAVAFSPLSSETHSIILTSGTLSPMNSFQSELGVNFKLQLEANHVVDLNQVFVGAIGQGPRGKPLCGTYQQTSTWEFQDELGALVLHVCQTVPGGILCFLPSYSMLNKLLERWQSTGLWDDISKVKEAMVEQRKGSDFQKDLLHFYTTIKNAEMEKGCSSINGVFFMAVHRGKVSEGLDFSDDNARAVIAVGIPFPSIKDIQVDLKKKYNNFHSRSRNLLSGNEWYEIQAYRALNQALGRCIRHRYDWGALLLVDQRFRGESAGRWESRHTRGLSKWVRNRVIEHKNFSETLRSLQGFVKNMLANPPSPPASSAGVLLAATQEPTIEKLNHNSVQDASTPSSLEAIQLAQTFTPDKSCTSKSFKSVSPGESLQEKSSPGQKKCNAAKEKREATNPVKAEAKCGSAGCEYGKENNEMSISSEKRLHTALDEADLDDFNLDFSPSTSWGGIPPPPRRKKVRQKKHIVYDLE